MASGAMTAICEAGMKVPEDISLVGYDELDIARCAYPKLTTIKSPVKELGFLAAERVLDLVEQKDREAGLPEIILEPGLVARDSTSYKQQRQFTGGPLK
jgi:LacI family purine nucleotide synthesis repressor